MSNTTNAVPIAILGFRETCYFGAAPGTGPGLSADSGDLLQWITVDLDNRTGRTLTVTAAIEASGQSATAALQVRPGSGSYRCLAPRRGPGPAAGTLTIEAEGARVSSAVTVGSYRPWTIHVLSDDCPDYVWGYDTELAYLADSVAVTQAELRAAEMFSREPEWNQNRYSFAVAREVQFYEQSHDEADTERLFGRIRDGSFTVNPIPTMSLSCSQGLEDMIRSLYLARRWERERGIRVRYANHQETPTSAWAMASVLAGAGIAFLVKGLLPFGTPWTARLTEPPVFLWEGPDGARILVRRYNHHYNEASFVLRDVAAINQAVERRVVPQYEALGSAYPLDHIGLVGCYSDLSSETRGYALKKATAISQYNAQGWEFPRLVNSSHEHFWRQVLPQPVSTLPVRRGDYGTSWEVWLLTLANLAARWRRLQERGPLADRLLAVARALDPRVAEGTEAAIAQGWDDLVSLSDHAWNGADEPNRRINLSLRRKWTQRGAAAFDGVVERALTTIASRLQAPAAGEPALLVMNGLGWQRTALASVELESEEGVAVVDTASGAEVPSQVIRRDGRPFLEFAARDLPSLGYRTYCLRPSRDAPPPTVVARGAAVDSPFHRLEVNPRTGGIASIYSKRLGRELVRPGDSLNRWLYRREGVDDAIASVSVESAVSGPVYGEVRVTTRSAHVEVLTTIRLYAATDRIDLRNEVTRATTDQRESLHVLFPFAVPGGQYRFEAPGAIVRAGEGSFGGEQLPGSGQAYTALRHFADVSNERIGVTLSQADSGFVQFGHRTEAEDPTGPSDADSTLVAFVLDNTVNYAEVTRDQGGDARFLFRFSIREHGPFDPLEAVRFAWEDNNEALVHRLPDPSSPIGGPADRRILAATHSFLRIAEDAMVLVNLKSAEEEPSTGVVVRIWNPTEKASDATLRLSPTLLIRKAWAADLLERPQGELRVAEDTLTVPVPARGYATVILRR